MPSRVLVLSGKVGAGKTELATGLAQRFNCVVIKSHELLKLATGHDERRALQRAGERLDRETDGRWLCNAVAEAALSYPSSAVIVVDAVRIKKQIDCMREAFVDIVVHAHLTAPPRVLAGRYSRRASRIAELKTYEEVSANKTERAVEELGGSADIMVDTDRCEVSDVVARVASRLGLYGREGDRLVDVVVGGQYGSEGKGQLAAYLAPEYSLLIRVGGPNAGHQVYDRPTPYTYRTLPSGTQKAPSAKVAIGPGAVIEKDILLREIRDCERDVTSVFIDPQAMIIHNWDKRKELDLVGALGSTGQGVGIATARRIMRGHFPARGAPVVQLARDVPELKLYLRETTELLENAYRNHERVLLEGTQGTGLSIFHGEYPKVTSRDTTASGCLSEAGVPPLRVRRVLMVCRTYPIRVGGNSGPMGREIRWRDIASRSGYSTRELTKKEKGSVSGNQRRVSEFNWAALRRAAKLNAPTDLALTFADYINSHNTSARRFDQLTEETIHFVEEMERVARAPVSLITTRFAYRAVIDRRHW